MGTGAGREADEVGRLFPAIYLLLHRRRPRGAYRPSAEASAVLQHLHATGPLTVREAAAHLQRAQATVSVILDRLERRGLVERMRDQRDRRRVLVWLTPAGLTLLDEEQRVLAPELVGGALAEMSPVERRALVTGMRALVRAAEAAAGSSRRPPSASTKRRTNPHEREREDDV